MPAQLRNILPRLRNLGLDERQDFRRRLRVQITNILICISLPFHLYYIITNYAAGRVEMSFFNALLLTCSIAVLYFHSRKIFYEATSHFLLISSFLFTGQAVLFHNGSEYLLLMNMVVVQLYYANWKPLFWMTLLNVALFMTAKYMGFQDPLVPTLIPQGKLLFNIFFALVFITIALQFFQVERAAYDERITLQTEALEEANRTKEKLLSIIAHDLRTPVGQLKGILELANKDFISLEEFRHLSALYYQQIDALEGNLENVLRWSHSQLKGIETKPDDLDIATELRAVAGLLSGQMGQKRILLHVTLDTSTVRCDPQHLQLVLRNLISNAVKYSREHHNIWIEGKVRERSYMLTVRDEGVGMDKDRLQQLFSKGPVESTRGTANEKGTGLGLQLCREFLAHNAGELSATSEPGKGTTFLIRLPLAAEADVAGPNTTEAFDILPPSIEPLPSTTQTRLKP